MKPRLSLCMIVRDEAANLERCLDSVAGLADEIVVVDTGSQDATPDIARRRGARVLEHPWTGDFAAARNAALRTATGGWILTLDADEELHPDDRAKVPGLLLTGNVEGYVCTVVNWVGETPGKEAELSHVQRLFRNRPEYRYQGLIHESVSLPAGRVREAPFRILHYGYLDGVIGGRRKRERNLKLLEAMASEHPDEHSVSFYLGIEYAALGRYQDAVEAYRRAKPALREGYLYVSKLMRNLAITLLLMGRPEEALVEVGEGLTHFPAFTDLVYLQGQAYRALGRYPEAIGCYHQCLAMGPAPVPPHHGVDPARAGWKAEYALALTHESRGEPDQAAVYYRRAFTHGGGAAPLGKLARLLLIRSGPAQAEADLTALAGRQDGDGCMLLAEALVAARHWSAALRSLARACGDDERIREWEGLCRFHLGDFAGAHAAFAAVAPERLKHRDEALVAALAAGVERPSDLLRRQAGPAEVRALVKSGLGAVISALEQGLLQRPDYRSLEAALAEALAEVRRLG